MLFLSSAWLAAVDEALSSSPQVAGAVAETSLRLLQVVTDGPEGDVAYLVTIESGVTHVGAASPHQVAEVTLTTTWATAVGISTGAVAPHDAFTTGGLLVRGDIEALRTQAPALADLHGAFAAIRAATAYD